MHKYVFQCTNIFSSAQIYFSVHKYVFQCTNVFSSAQICNWIWWKPGYQSVPVPNWLPFCITKTITTRPEGLFNSVLESMFCTFRGAQVPISFAFCPSCGGSLRNDHQASADRGSSTCMLYIPDSWNEASKKRSDWDFLRMLIIMSVKLTLTDELLKVTSALKLLFSVIEGQCSGGQRSSKWGRQHFKTSSR